jgi:outer membrane protein
MKVRSRFLIASCFFANFIWAQTPANWPAATTFREGPSSSISRSYRVGGLPSTKFQNSDRLVALIKDGKLYLSLQDAIALALENNLDIELERYAPRMADTDLWRAQAGSLLRGVPLSAQEGPEGK